MKVYKRLRRKHFLIAFCLIVFALWLVKRINPNLDFHATDAETPQPQQFQARPDSIMKHSWTVDSLLIRKRPPLVLLTPDGKPIKNRVVSVRRFEDAFPDLNDVQLATASRMGVARTRDRAEAMRNKAKLVYIGDNPYYTVLPLSHSIPYLVPRAAVLLNEIARAFNDSLATKGYEPHKLLITSVLRTEEDVQKLRNVNRNASANSCHRFGTTFDISYNRFIQVTDDPQTNGAIHWVTVFKSILAEVLEDQRLMGTCYVKYERQQSCFHITAR